VHEQNGFVLSIKESELKEGQMKLVRVRGRPILLVRRDGGFLEYQTVARIWRIDKLKAFYLFNKRKSFKLSCINLLGWLMV
jgi:hypothetical protein